MIPRLSTLRLKMREIWARRSGLMTVTAYLAIVEVVLLLWCVVARLVSPKYTGPTGWVYFVGLCLAVCLILLGFRWFRQVAMWRLRNRLIVTYVFIGVIPVALLVLIAVITAYLFAGQFATFVISSDIHSDLKSLATKNQALAESLAGQVKSGASLERALATTHVDESQGTLTVWMQPAQGPARAYSLPKGAADVPLPPARLANESRVVVGRGDGMHLYAWATVPAGRDRLTAISTQSLGSAEIQRVAAELGEITVYPPNFDAEFKPKDEGSDAGGVTIETSEDKAGGKSSGKGRQGGKAEPKGSGSIVIRNGNQVLVRTPNTQQLVPTLPPITAGALPPPRDRFDREVLFGMPFKVVDWKTGESSSALMRVLTRPSLLYGRLFAALGEFANLIFLLLVGIAVFFALIELVALITGVRLTRTMTRSVAALYVATQHINQGDLNHRIKVKSQDQLAALETSFNSMTDSLQKLIAEQKEKQRMESELAIAQEVQAQLFPGETSQLDSLEVHGVCRPARTVSGDYYDFLQLGHEKLGIAVGDISGKGISAALLMATIHSAVRVYEFGRMPEREQLVAAGAAAMSAVHGGGSVVAAGAIESPAAVLTLLNRHLFHSTPPEKYATLFLGLWNGHTRRLSYSNGGHLPPLVIGTDGSLRKLEQGGTVIGLFDEMQWEEDTVELRSGDLFVAYSDGVTEPENEFGEFGEQRLIELLQENRHLPLARIADEILAAVDNWIGANEQPDDVTVVLARAR